ncbi:hypothetical protein H5T88_08850, partial [bacterium]|nr:hypothetical protein [bacterium]
MTDYFGGQTSYSYDALGRLTSLTNPYLGELGYYGDAGMYLLTQRWYNPMIGRFGVKDLVNFGKLRASEGYRYVANNPASSVHTYGRIPIPPFIYKLLNLGAAVSCL